MYVIGQQGLCDAFTILNRVRWSRVPPSLAAFTSWGNVFAHIQIHEIKNSTKHRLSFPLHVLYLKRMWGAPVDPAVPLYQCVLGICVCCFQGNSVDFSAE